MAKMDFEAARKAMLVTSSEEESSAEEEEEEEDYSSGDEPRELRITPHVASTCRFLPDCSSPCSLLFSDALQVATSRSDTVVVPRRSRKRCPRRRSSTASRRGRWIKSWQRTSTTRVRWST